VSVIGGDTLGIGQGIGTFASRAAVVASAVEDALSGARVRVERMPLTPGALRQLLWS